MSAGMRSGVNWIRENFSPSEDEIPLAKQGDQCGPDNLVVADDHLLDR